MAKKRPDPARPEAPAEAVEFIEDAGSDHLLAPGPEVVEEIWEGDDDAIVIGADEAAPITSADGEESGEGRAGEEQDATHPRAGDETAGVANELADTIDAEIHELASERDTYRDIAQRLQADFDNYRKRVSAQIDADVDRATGRLAEALLPALDAVEAAYVQHPEEVGPLLNVLLAELRKHGLESIELLDKPFDPNLADAVAHEPGDGGEIVVAEVLRSGYTWKGRTLRPAMVRTRD